MRGTRRDVGQDLGIYAIAVLVALLGGAATYYALAARLGC